MFNKFKNNEIVAVNGIGKCDGTIYFGFYGKVICRDPYFLDYNILLDNGKEDWFDAKYLRKVGRMEIYENNIYKNKWF